MLHKKFFPVLLCTTKLAQSTSQYFFVLQSLHFVLQSLHHSRNRRTQDLPFIAGCSRFTRKNARFRAPASSPTQVPCNSHAAITVTTSLSHHLPLSPLPFVTASLGHHFPQSPLAFNTTPRHSHHFPWCIVLYCFVMYCYVMYILLCDVLLCDVKSHTTLRDVLLCDVKSLTIKVIRNSEGCFPTSFDNLQSI